LSTVISNLTSRARPTRSTSASNGAARHRLANTPNLKVGHRWRETSINHRRHSRGAGPVPINTSRSISLAGGLRRKDHDPGAMMRKRADHTGCWWMTSVLRGAQQRLVLRRVVRRPPASGAVRGYQQLHATPSTSASTNATNHQRRHVQRYRRRKPLLRLLLHRPA